MKKFSAFGLLALLLGTTCSAAYAQEEKKTAPYVVVISLDGFPARVLQNPKLPMPTLRKLMAQGSYAKTMQPINPTVTWPNHTTLITGVDAGKHHVMANGLITFPAGGGEPEIEPWVDKEKLVHAHTLYEAATEKGLTTAQVDWVAIYGAHGVTWDFGERPDPSSAISKELVQAGVLTQQEVDQFHNNSNPAWRDEMWTNAAVDMIEKHKPNLLLLHLLQTDTIQHLYGATTPAAYAAYAYADTRIARVIEAVRQAGLLDQTTFFIVSDHGFSSFTHSINLNVGLVQQGYAKAAGGHVTGAVLMKAEGGGAEVFIPDAQKRATLVPKLKEYFASLPGIAHVYTNKEAQAIGLPADNDGNDQAPQLFLTAQHDYAFSDDLASALITVHAVEGQHGYLNTESDMQALFVAAGAHVRQGVVLDSIENRRVAPTIAAILGVKLEDAKEDTITEILK